VGSAILGAGCIFSCDIDCDALSICKENFNDFEIANSELLLCDVSKLSDESNSHLHKRFDTVLMNPPFGTKHNWGLDMLFLKSGLALAKTAVYSLHKTSTRDHILKKAADWGVKATVVAQLRYDLKGGKYKHHKKQVVDIEVDFYRFEVPKSNN
jgi:predicted RNA methylase